MRYEDVVNHRVADVPPSGIRKFFDIVRHMPEAISLGVGEPDFVTPWSIRDAAIASIEEGRTQYTSNWGLESLREKIAAYLRMRYLLPMRYGAVALCLAAALIAFYMGRELSPRPRRDKKA